MRVLLVGAGAIGRVLYRALDQTKGNEVTFLVRPGRRAALERLKVVDARSGEIRVRERPAAIELGQARPVVDTVLFCVRGDQLAAALDDVGAVLPGTRLATITPGPDGLTLLRARHAGHPVARVAPAFMAYAEADAIVTWFPPIVKTPVTPDGDEAGSAAFAEELAGALAAGGVPAAARAKMFAGIDAGGDAFMPVLAAYALAGYDAAALARDGALLDLTGGAVGEAMTIGGAPGFAGAMARRAAPPLVRAALAAAPRMPDTFRAMWRAHAPKIEAQTRAILADLVRRSGDRPAPSLSELVRRLDARPAPATPAVSA